jgi:hypothetical protein
LETYKVLSGGEVKLSELMTNYPNEFARYVRGVSEYARALPDIPADLQLHNSIYVELVEEMISAVPDIAIEGTISIPDMSHDAIVGLHKRLANEAMREFDRRGCPMENAVSL